MDQITAYLNENWVKLLIYGVGGLVLVSLIVLFLRSSNGRWRWQK